MQSLIAKLLVGFDGEKFIVENSLSSLCCYVLMTPQTTSFYGSNLA